MGGDDGCLYEMTYQGLADGQPSQDGSVEKRLNEFYDEGKDLPAVLNVDNGNNIAQSAFALGKRAWSAMSPTSPDRDRSPEEERPSKCRKLNRTSGALSWASAVLPDFLFSVRTSTGGGRIERMVVDEDRECLYTLSSDGWICSFDLRTLSAGKDSIRLAAVMQTPRTVRAYLEAVSRGQMLPPSTHGATMGTVSFVGGGAAAQAGVSGMEGARKILKAADLGERMSRGSRKARDSIMNPVSIHVIPPTESQRLTLLAVTEGGLRLYISSLSHAVLSSGPKGYGSLAPYSRLTLCHVRSPPPSDRTRLQNLASSDDAGVVGGVKPQVVTGSGEKIPRVDASYYKHGMFVAAVGGPKKPESGAVTEDPVGDVVVTACPDAVARKIETLGSNNVGKPKALKGITETASLPMLSAYGGSVVDANPILPGGLVWDISVVGDEETSVLKLAWNSQTPPDSEIGAGLAPAYFPPSKIRGKDARRTGSSNGNATRHITASDTVAVNNGSLSSTALQVLGKVITRTLLGIEVQPPSPMPDMRDYRVSKRDGSDGFSTTAAESSRYGSRSQSGLSRSLSKTLVPKSARLRLSLLRPAAAPLNQFSMQHLVKPRQAIALNAGGLHYFEINSVLSNLADALRRGQNASRDPSVTAFFTSYGYKEGCAMCLALAIGCGPAASNAVDDEDIRSRAKAAALARANRPRLVLLSNQSNAYTTVTTSSTDSLIPPGYEFHASDLCKGLISLISRLLRPVWHKPAVVVTEGRTIQKRWSSFPRPTPAKVEVLLSENTLHDIRAPLKRLLVLMKDSFSPAVRTVPGVAQRHDNMMDIDPDNGDAQLARRLQHDSDLRVSSQLSAPEAERLAQLVEEKNIHSQYRLLSRTVQLLNLFSLLHEAQEMIELKEVEWGLLHGLTFSQLVQSPDGQDRLESLLNTLVTTSMANKRMGTAEVDRLANQFADQCYLFYSPGSRSAYQGTRFANEALSRPYGDSQRAALINTAARHYLDAARHWHSAPLVTGRIIHPKDQETIEQIACKALQYGSPLATAVDILVRLEDVVGVVDVCLKTASNFKDSRALTIASAADFSGLQTNADGYDLPWEQHLYHKRREPDSNAASPGSRSPSSPSSATGGVAYGATVTSKDAIETCYALIFYHLSVLFVENPGLAQNMVSKCAAASVDDFLGNFYNFLLTNRPDQLIMINSTEVAEWLEERNDTNMLYKYYIYHGKAFDAGEVAWSLATDHESKLPLNERIDCLIRALDSYTVALREVPPVTSEEVLRRHREEASDRLEIAKIQKRILESAQGAGMTSEELDKLETSVIDAAELYNDYAAKFDMSELCLSLMCACRYDQHRDEILRLWKKVIFPDIYPCATRSEVAYSFLRQFAAELGVQENVVAFLTETQASGDLQLFETGRWAQLLEERLVRLGKELYSNRTEFIFPVDDLLDIMESTYCCSEVVFS